MYMQTFILFNILLVLYRVQGNSIDMCTCTPQNPSPRVRTTTHLRRFHQTLGHVRGQLRNNLTHFRRISRNQGIMFDLNIPPVSLFRDGDDMIDDMFVAYQALTEIEVNLTVFNQIYTMGIIPHWTNLIKIPACHLSKAIKSLGYDPPCSVCRRPRAQPPHGSTTSQSVASDYVYETLRKAIDILDAVRGHFQTFNMCNM